MFLFDIKKTGKTLKHFSALDEYEMKMFKLSVEVAM